MTRSRAKALGITLWPGIGEAEEAEYKAANVQSGAGDVDDLLSESDQSNDGSVAGGDEGTCSAEGEDSPPPSSPTGGHPAGSGSGDSGDAAHQDGGYKQQSPELRSAEASATDEASDDAAAYNEDSTTASDEEQPNDDEGVRKGDIPDEFWCLVRPPADGPSFTGKLLRRIRERRRANNWGEDTRQEMLRAKRLLVLVVSQLRQKVTFSVLCRRFAY
jgi:hypothetical protein